MEKVNFLLTIHLLKIPAWTFLDIVMTLIRWFLHFLSLSPAMYLAGYTHSLANALTFFPSFPPGRKIHTLDELNNLLSLYL